MSMSEFWNSHSILKGIAIGLVLWLLGVILWMMSGILPSFAVLIDELIFGVAVIGIAVYLWINRTATRAFGVVTAIAFGYLAIPTIAKAVWFTSTSSTFIGTVVDVYNDESAEGGVRRTFVIKNDATGVTDEYVSRDAVIFPFVFHTDSGRTRRNMVIGAKMEFKEYGTRRFKDQIPVIGNFLGLGYVSGDWSSFPNIYKAELITSPGGTPKPSSD